MPVIPLKLLTYDDGKDINRIIDVLNQNFRYLDWLLNFKNLDDSNVSLNAFIDPAQIKYYPNYCFNSSFEVFDNVTMKPSYWDTDGFVTDETFFEGEYSLKLEPGQSAKQIAVGGIGLANPSIWSWCDTRIGFRVKGAGGEVTVKVKLDGDYLGLWYWVEEAGGSVKSKLSKSLVFQAGDDWNNSLRTFTAVTRNKTGGLSIEFENTGETDIYIDCVTIEADCNKWSSLHTEGPRSGFGSDIFIEYKRVPYQKDITIYFSRKYPWPPVVTAGIGYDFTSTISEYTMTPHILCLTRDEAGVRWYNGVRIVWAGGPTSISNAYVMMIAVCRG